MRLPTALEAVTMSVGGAASVISRPVRRLALLGAVLVLSGAARAADWPTWRFDAGRTAATSEELPEKLYLQWTRDYPVLKPAWPDSSRLRFDTGYRPIAAAGKVFVASSHNDSVTALDAASGAEKWCFHADGPVRFAPCYWRGGVFFASDDGYLYCVSGKGGNLLWKYAGAPGVGRKVIGNGRLISTWPVRGAPVIADGKVYMASGIWPFMGVFIHAVDAANGERIWTNSGTGSIFMNQPHSSPAFAGLAPQGYLAVNGDRLLVPNGRSVAACLRRSDGGLLYYRLAENQRNGKYFLATRGDVFFNSYSKFNLADGGRLGRQMSSPVLGPKAGYHSESLRRAVLRKPFGPEVPLRWYLRSGGWYKQWGLRGEGAPHIWLQAGSRLYAAGVGKVLALQVPARNNSEPKVVWQARFKGSPCSLIAADGRLLVSTLEGRILCFGGKRVVPKEYEYATEHAERHGPGIELAGAAVKATGIKSGYCLTLGDDAIRAGAALAEGGHEFEAISLVDARAKLAGVRHSLNRRGLYGQKMMIVRDEPGLRLPPYFASLVLYAGKSIPDGIAARTVRRTFRLLRPYGGTACFPVDDFARVKVAVVNLKLAGAEVRKVGRFVLLTRKGALAGAGSWTHQYGNSANTVSSADTLVKAPLGLLWFGGASNRKILPRHGHGPNPHVAGGRIVIEGPNVLRALDVYTGRRLWETELPGLGKHYDSTAHQPGANSLGSNYVTLPDVVYVVHEGRCLALNAVNGKKTIEFRLPSAPAGANESSGWGYIGVHRGVLVGGAAPMSLYDPDFSPAGLKAHIMEMDELDRMIEWMRKVKDFELPLMKKGERRSYYCARNLNRLLRLKDLAGRLPAAGRNTDAIATRLRIYLRENPKASGDEVRLREINRALIHAASGSIPANRRQEPGSWGFDGVSSRRLVAFDRVTGKVLWQITARQAFVHNAICAGGGKIFCVDRYPPLLARGLEFKGKKTPTARLMAIEATTGKVLWSVEKEVFAPFLSYSEAHDILLQASRRSRDHLPEFGSRAIAHRGIDGKILWKQRMQNGPPMIIGKRLYTQGAALQLMTGKPVMRVSPLTGSIAPWRYKRKYGCNTVIGSTNLLTFRSAAAGFYDLARDGGTGNLGGFKSGCSSNLIVADGVLAAPDYTRTCNCSYQNQSSLAVIHDPEAEFWTFNSWPWTGQAVKRIGINFGAPGDRVSSRGTIWLDYPSLGHRSPDIPVRISPLKPLPADVVWSYARDAAERMPVFFRMHSSEVASADCRWVAASGLSEVDKLEIDLGRGKARRYRLRLHFLEPQEIRAGRRVFDVVVQDRRLLRGVDVVKEAGGARRALVKELKGIRVKQKLMLEFKPRRGSRKAVISGIEIVREE